MNKNFYFFIKMSCCTEQICSRKKCRKGYNCSSKHYDEKYSYCNKCKCRATNCNNEALPQKRNCLEHQCNNGNCTEAKIGVMDLLPLLTLYLIDDIAKIAGSYAINQFCKHCTCHAEGCSEANYGKMFCKQHRCKICPRQRDSDKTYCISCSCQTCDKLYNSNHTNDTCKCRCKYHYGCVVSIVGLGDKNHRFCPQHVCQTPKCYGQIMLKRNHCVLHGCKVTDCKNAQVDNSDYCFNHKCSKDNCNTLAVMKLTNSGERIQSKYCLKHA